MKKVSLGLVTSVCTILLCLFLFSGCEPEYTAEDILQGRYICGQASITIKEDNKIFCENVDFSEAQAEFDNHDIDIDLNECAQSDIAYEVAESDPTHMYLLVSDLLVLNMLYDFQNSSITFLNNIYVLEQ